MADTEKLPLAEVYIDESSQTNHRYLVLGGVIAETSDVQVASESIAQARLPELPSGTMKWGKVSRSKLAAYIRVVDRFFELGDTMTLDFPLSGRRHDEARSRKVQPRKPRRGLQQGNLPTRHKISALLQGALSYLPRLTQPAESRPRRRGFDATSQV